MKGVKLTPPPEKTSLKRTSLIKIKDLNEQQSLEKLLY